MVARSVGAPSRSLPPFSGASMFVLPIFLHIPRTAGTTLRVLLESQIPVDQILTLYGDRITNATSVAKQTDPSKLALVRGHMTFGVHRHIRRPSAYFTMLRDPLSRTVSLYKYIRRDRAHWANAQTLKMTFNQFLESGITLETNNGMVRQLCESEGPLPQQPYGRTSTKFGHCSRSLLDEALHNLKAFFLVVGITEQYEKSARRICLSFGWDYKRVGKKVNATRHDPNIQVNEKLFWQLNELDRQLYAEGAKWLQL